MFHAHLLYTPDETYLEHLKTLLDESVTLTTGSELPDPATFHLLVTGRPTPEQLEASPNLQTLLIPFSGLPQSTQNLMPNYPHIKIHNIHHNAPSTAEMALTLMMTAVKRIVPADRVFRTHDWTPRHAPMPSQLLAGKTILILGYGHIGQRVAAVCQALDMKVLAIKRREPFPENVYPSEQLHELLPRANILMVCLPLTEDTRGVIGEEEIDLLPDQAVIVNIGRAHIVDEKALYEGLRDGKLHGAGFDVWYRYPPDVASRSHTPPADYPFYELDTMVMSPHRAGGVHTAEVELARMAALARSINAAARGDAIPDSVDLNAGY